MDGQRFDDLTRLLAGGTSRRRVLRGLAGGVLGAVGLGRVAEGGACRTAGHPCEGNQDCCPDLVCLSSGPGAAARCTPCPPGMIACGGACIPACIALDQCHDVGVCDPATGACSNPPKTAGAACDDGNACTRNDRCDGAGTCVGGDPVVCTASDQCHDAGTCDPATGACSDPPKPDGTPCSDDSACTDTDTCQEGVCTPGTTVVCQPLDQCHDAGVCDPQTGLCSNPAKLDGAPCETENRCTADTCQDGVCQQGPVAVACPAPTECQESVACNPATGQCDQIVNRPAGLACGEPASCTDGVAHAADVCDGDGNCVSGADTPCGLGEECDGTTCAPVACLAPQAPCDPGGTPLDNRCCQAEPTFCEDVPGCGGEAQTQCCHVGGGSCAESCDCCGLDVCEGNRCCHPSGTACDVFEVNACCGQNVCDGGRCCRPQGARCSFFEVDDCCIGSCNGEVCRCHDVGTACSLDADCCDFHQPSSVRPNSTVGQCAPLDNDDGPPVCCRSRGEVCSQPSDCCQSQQTGVQVTCDGGRCCSRAGDGCLRNSDCCSNDCCVECGGLLFGQCR